MMNWLSRVSAGLKFAAIFFTLSIYGTVNAAELVITQITGTVNQVTVSWIVDNKQAPPQYACTISSGCRIGFGFVLGGDVTFNSSEQIQVPNLTTIDGASALWRSQKGTSGTNVLACGGQGCVVAKYCFATTDMSYINSRCLTTARDPGYVRPTCSFNGTANIAHGNLTTANVNGNVASVVVNGQCDRNAAVKITTSPNVNLGRGVTSTVRINNVGQGGILQMAAGTRGYTISSTLSGTPTSVGGLSGNSVIIIDYQ